MRQHRPGETGAPTLEHLAAYVDGELDPALRRVVETWLNDHPDAAAEVEAHRKLVQLWQATAPAVPETAQWVTCSAQVQAAVFPARPALLRRRRQLSRTVTAAAGLAAALLVVLLWPPGPEPVESPPPDETLAVVSADDVDIVSLHAADRVTLVVGVPPVTGPLVLASPGDVELEAVEPYADGMVPDVHMDHGAVAPMIVAPLDTGSARTPGNFRE